MPDNGPGDNGQNTRDNGQNAKDSGTSSQLPRMSFVYDGKYIFSALGAINSAKNSIYMTELEFIDGSKPTSLRYALINARKRGVTVRVVLEDNVDNNYEEYNALKKGGVDVKYDGNGSNLHAKTIVIDGHIVLVGSTNLSQSSLAHNHETDIVFNDTQTGAAFVRYFNDIWNNPLNKAKPGACGSGITCFGDDEYYNNVYPVLNSAKKDIRMVMYSITQSTKSSALQGKLCNALIDAHSRGVDVRVILERLDYKDDVNNDNAKAAAKLKQGGVSVRFDPDDVITHAKMLIIDDKVVVSTNNWSRSGLISNHEAGVIVQDSTVTADALKYFRDLWAVSQ